MKKNIALVLTSLKSGGLERNASLLANHFSSLGHNVTIYCIYSTKCFFQLDSQISIVDLSTKKSKLTSFKIWKKELNKLFIRNSVNTVISFGDRCGILCASAVKGLNINHICRGVNTKKNLLNKILLSRNIKNINTFVFQTEAQKKLYGTSLAKKGVVIPNPFFLEKQNLNRDGLQSKRFVTVASFKLKQKRQDFMIKAFAEFSKTHPDYYFELYGRYDDESKKCIDSLIADLHISNKVKIMGESNDVKNAIVPSRAFICASSYEGMPNALIESLSYGIPVITSKWSGHNEIIDDEINGLVYDAEGVDGLVKAMSKMTDDNLFISLSEKAYKHRIVNFSYENVFKVWDGII